jgi:S-adenosylmethionine decarboxylase
MTLALPPVATDSNASITSVAAEYRDLAPMITRQRLVVEGYPTFVITAEHIKDYLSQLSVVTDMITLIEPVTHVSDLYGWAGWIHWETSGAHFYSWERPVSFFSVDIYTCKAFDPRAVVEFTEQYFRTTEIVAKGF